MRSSSLKATLKRSQPVGWGSIRNNCPGPSMSDRVAVFNDGVIQQLAPVEALYETPSNRFVAGFVGDSTVLKGKAGTAGIELPDGRVLGGINVNQAPAGAQVEAYIRPERIVLHRQPLPALANVLAARVARVIYFGDHLRLLCDLGEGQAEATVKLPLIALDGLASPQPGEAVHLEFPAAFTRIYGT